MQSGAGSCTEFPGDRLLYGMCRRQDTVQRRLQSPAGASHQSGEALSQSHTVCSSVGGVLRHFTELSCLAICLSQDDMALFALCTAGVDLRSADFGKSVCVELVAGLLTCTVASVDHCHLSCHCWLQIKECHLGTRTCKRANARGSKKYPRSILFMESRPGGPCRPLLVCLFRPSCPPPGACVLQSSALFLAPLC